MILLLGGTSDSIEIARLLIKEGLSHIFSMATGTAMDLPKSPLVTLRRGALDRNAMEESILNDNINLLIDATHPYATEVTRNVSLVAKETGVRYFRLTRKPVVEDRAGIIFAKDHEAAACKAVALGGTILVTIGIRNLAVYATICSGNGPRLVVRALPNQHSLKILQDLGIPLDDTIIGQGPFSYEDNVLAIKKFGVKTLVTKDSGTRGGTEEKIRAAHDEGCKVIVVQRPPSDETGSFSEPCELVNAVKDYLTTMSSKREGVDSTTML